ncbi:MAG: DUF721 domain-containing protein [Bacteroidales bacterium]|nr:DUF721 domain-containing protein [Bacteroidales bacterium]
MPEFRKVKGVPRKEALGMDVMVPMFIRALKLGAGLNTQRVFAAWDEVSGAKDFTLRKFYRDGKLFITLSSSMVRTHLELQKEALLPALNAFLEKDSLFSGDDGKVGFVKEIILK